MIEYKLREIEGDVRGCEACGMEVATAAFDCGPFQKPAPADGQNWFCAVCATTLSGNSYVYPNQYPRELMRHVAACTNILLAEIRRLHPATAPPEPMGERARQADSSGAFDPEKIEREYFGNSQALGYWDEKPREIVKGEDYDKLLALYREGAHANKLMARTVNDLLVWRKHPEAFTEGAT